MFRRLHSIPLSYRRQGLIFFLCLNYNFLPEAMQQRIFQLCIEITDKYYQALFKFLITDPAEIPAWRIANDYFVPVNKLYQLRREFYVRYDKKFKSEIYAV